MSWNAPGFWYRVGWMKPTGPLPTAIRSSLILLINEAQMGHEALVPSRDVRRCRTLWCYGLTSDEGRGAVLGLLVLRKHRRRQATHVDDNHVVSALLLALWAYEGGLLGEILTRWRCRDN